MPRVKRAKTHVARRKRLLKQTKGYRWQRKKTIRLGRVAVLKAGQHAFRDRRFKKRSSRNLWQIQINAAVRPHGLSYSRFINLLKVNKIELDRKVLAQIAGKYPKVFDAIIKEIKK